MAGKRKTRKRRTGIPQGRAYLFAWVAQSPGSPPQVERVDILSEEHPTCMMAVVGSGTPPLPQLILVTSATGRDYPAAREKIIERIQRTQAFVWLLPWVEYWNRGAQRPSRASSVAQAFAQEGALPPR